jgi:glucose-1-phosphate adenylyltransferase
LLSTGVRTHSWSELDEVVALPRCQIGRGARLTRAILDRGVVIPPGMVVGDDPDEDAARFHRTESGICLITPEMIERLA